MVKGKRKQGSLVYNKSRLCPHNLLCCTLQTSVIGQYSVMTPPNSLCITDIMQAMFEYVLYKCSELC